MEVINCIESLDICLESKKGVEKENSAVPTGKRKRENVSPLRCNSISAAENEMNPKKKPRQETINDQKG